MEFDDSSDEKQADSEMANNDVKLNNNHSQPKQPLIMELESKEFKSSQVKTSNEMKSMKLKQQNINRRPAMSTKF